MNFPRAFHQAEPSAKFAVKRFGIRAHGIEAAAFHRALGAAGAHNHVTARLDRAREAHPSPQVARSTRAKELSRRGRDRLTWSGALAPYTPSQCGHIARILAHATDCSLLRADPATRIPR